MNIDPNNGLGPKSAHASVEEWMRYLEGELTIARAQELESEHQSCAQCPSLRAEAEKLLEELRDVPEALLQIDLRPQLQLQQAPRALPRRRWPWGVGAALAAALALFVIAPPQPGFRPKRAPTSADAWVGLEAFVIEQGRARALRDAPISPDQALAFAFRNIGPSPFSHLMIFGLSEQGEVFWYYPSYTDAKTNPSSIPISKGAQDLPDRISHALPHGPLHLYGLFTRAPWTVKRVEALTSSIKPGDRLELERSGQHILKVKVGP